ncbi:NADPH2:quinone reductase [bacterium A37T11]|nr:NADPH2:quinone reductase [bacterium A37T11]
MQAAVLVRTGPADRAFEIRELPRPEPGDDEILIQVTAFGLNYADIMAIQGKYRDAPPLPSVLGYDVCGHVVAVGKDVNQHQVGDYVTAMTRFGGYAEYAVTGQQAAAGIPENTKPSIALALATQAATAWYCAEEVSSIYEGERVIITAAAGGVGSLVLQLAKRRKAIVYGIVSSETKEHIILNLGADGVLNRSKGDVFDQYQQYEGYRGIDILFDSAGGSYIRKGMNNLAPGGRVVGYGGSQGTNATNIFKLIAFGLSFGLYHPAPFLLEGYGLIGVNMLRLADHKPHVVHTCMAQSIQLFNEGELRPLDGQVFPISQLADAHHALKLGLVPGKIAVKW